MGLYSNPGSYPFPIIDKLCYNRTGAAVATGQIVQLDLSGSAQSETTGNPLNENDTANEFASVCAVTTAGLGTILGVVLADSDAAADNALIKVRFSGPVQALLDGTTDVVRGDALVGVNAATNLAKAGAGAAACAISLVDYTTNSAALKNVIMLGPSRQIA